MNGQRQPVGMFSKGWSLALLTILVLALTLWACNSPTEPSREADPAARAPTTGTATTTATTLSVAAASTKVETNQSTTITITITGLGSSSLPGPVGVATDLGNFGTDATGATITTLECNTSGTSCVISTVGSTQQASFTFFGGSTTGNANIVATLGTSSANVVVEVATPTALFLQSISPNVGEPAGGETVTITGVGLENNARVTFGGALGTFNSIDSTETSISVTTPQSPSEVAVGSLLVVDVVVETPDTGNGTQTDTLTGAYTYAHGSVTDIPAITIVDPEAGPNKGGQAVSIRGSGFETGGNVVVQFGTGTTTNSFNGVSATIESSTATEIKVRSPLAPQSLQNQTVDILVRNKTSGLATLGGSLYTYEGEDVVTDIQPREYSYKGSGSSRPVTIQTTGVDANSILLVEFGGSFQATCTNSTNDADCQVTENSRLTVLRTTVAEVAVSNCSPPSGNVTVSDRLTGETATGPLFTYLVNEPVISSVSQVTTEATGGTTATISGTFHPTEEAQSTVSVLIDGQAATITGYTSSGITVTTPAFTGTFDTVSCGTNGTQSIAKQVDVEVLYTNSGCSTSSTGSFTYTPTATELTCVEAAETPVAGFSFAFDSSDPTNLTVLFTDDSLNAATYNWSFGDGQTANTVGPHTIVYTNDTLTTFDVSLTVTNSDGSASDTKTLSVDVGTTVTADFTATVGTPSSDCSTFPVTLVNNSQNATDYVWTFGDGQSAFTETPTLEYTAAGTYTITLDASLTGGSKTLSASTSQAVTVAVPTPVADFSSSTSSAAAPWDMVFTDASSNCPETWVWNFGDGNSDTTSTGDTTHTYAADGTYEVSLTVTNSTGSSEVIKTLNLVTPAAAPSAEPE